MPACPTPVGFNLKIRNNATYQAVLYIKDQNGNAVPLSGFTALMQFRDQPNTSGNLLYTCSTSGLVAGSVGLLSFGDDPDLGAISITIPQADALTFHWSSNPTPNTAYFDVALTDPQGNVYVVPTDAAGDPLYGVATLFQGITT